MPHSGRRPSILLLHGVQSGSTTWWRISDDLTDLGWEVIALDLLGMGSRNSLGPTQLSLDAMVDDVLDQVGDSTFDLVAGHSLGAVVAVIVCTRRPHLSRGVVLEDPPTNPGRADPAQIADGMVHSVARARADPAGEAALALEQNRLWSPVDAMNAIENRRAVDVDRVADFLRGSRWDLDQLTAMCPVPICLLAATPPNTAMVDPMRSAVLDALPPEQVHVIDSGHSVHRDRPGLWLVAVTQFAAAL